MAILYTFEKLDDYTFGKWYTFHNTLTTIVYKPLLIRNTGKGRRRQLTSSVNLQMILSPYRYRHFPLTLVIKARSSKQSSFTTQNRIVNINFP